MTATDVAQRLVCMICRTRYQLVYPRPMCTRERADGSGPCGGLLAIAITTELEEPDGEQHDNGHAAHDPDASEHGADD